ncbi:hypothetical protein ACFOG5_02930 [Pedobacter fastidiosus]|uniref:hypothetical protein n=1 Tax=Pedobacter fastidiosus TaxID=2765361 RepID=UPI0036126DCF
MNVNCKDFLLSPSFRLEHSGTEKPLNISFKDFLLCVISTGAQRNGETFDISFKDFRLSVISTGAQRNGETFGH